MGGHGSGPQERSEKQLVEDSLVIDINSIVRVGAGDGRARTIGWENQGRDVASVNVKLSKGRLGVLMFIAGRDGGQKSFEFQDIEIVTTPCNYGGERRWLVCPGRVEELEATGASNFLGDGGALWKESRQVVPTARGNAVFMPTLP